MYYMINKYEEIILYILKVSGNFIKWVSFLTTYKVECYLY